MNESKYVVFGQKALPDFDPPVSEDTPGSETHVLVFGLSQSHVDVARSYENEFPGLRPVAAGFLQLSSDPRTGSCRVSCYGKSTTLNLKSRDCDAMIVAKALGIYRRNGD